MAVLSGGIAHGDALRRHGKHFPTYKLVFIIVSFDINNYPGQR
jgi:hypothetical protein